MLENNNVNNEKNINQNNNLNYNLNNNQNNDSNAYKNNNQRSNLNNIESEEEKRKAKKYLYIFYTSCIIFFISCIMYICTFSSVYFISGRRLTSIVTVCSLLIGLIAIITGKIRCPNNKTIKTLLLVTICYLILVIIPTASSIISCSQIIGLDLFG